MFLRKMALFLCLLLLILVAMNYWMDRELHPHYPLQYQEVFSPKVNADVVILGASDATHGINPRYLESDGLKVFNFALNGAGPLFYLNWYRKIFRTHYRRPCCVIYAVHWGMFDDQLLKRKLENDSKYFPAQYFFKEMRDMETLGTLLLNRFAFLRERKQLAGRLFGKRTRAVFRVAGYYQGFIPYETNRSLDERDTVTPRNSKVEIEALETLVEEVRKDGVKVIFVHVPGYLPGRAASDSVDGMRILRLVAETKGIPFFDYQTERISAINSDPTLFSDNVHLNGKGSEAFSKLLKKDLGVEFGKLRDRPGLTSHLYETGRY